MENKNFTVTILVDKTPEEVYKAINNVCGWWWGDINGNTDTLDAEFTYTVKDVHFSVQKISELVPAKRIVWHVEDATLNFAENKKEWKGSDIVFDIVNKGNQTEVCFTHVGLIPSYECYDRCSNAWGTLVSKNLYNLIKTGKNQPKPW